MNVNTPNDGFTKPNKIERGGNAPLGLDHCTADPTGRTDDSNSSVPIVEYPQNLAPCDPSKLSLVRSVFALTVILILVHRPGPDSYATRIPKRSCHNYCYE